MDDGRRKRRKLYLTDPTKHVPKTTAWRLGQKKLSSTNTVKKRRVYCRDASYMIPQSTLWVWKKKKDGDDVSDEHEEDDCDDSVNDECESSIGEEDSDDQHDESNEIKSVDSFSIGEQGDRNDAYFCEYDDNSSGDNTDAFREFESDSDKEQTSSDDEHDHSDSDGSNSEQCENQLSTSKSSGKYRQFYSIDSFALERIC